MYTKKELFEFQSRIDVIDAINAPTYKATPNAPVMKIWDADEGVISVSANKKKASNRGIYSGGLKFSYALLPKKQTYVKDILVKRKFFGSKLKRVTYEEGGDFNYVVFHDKAPFTDKDLKVLNTHSNWYKRNVAGWRRDPAKIYDNFEKATTVVSGEYSDFIELTKKLKTEKDRDLNIYYEYNKGNIALDDVLNRFQLEIINGYDNKSIHLSGPAGTGKSVVAGKIYADLESKMAIVPNENVKKDYEGEQTFTYSEFATSVRKSIADNFKSLIKEYKIPKSMTSNQSFTSKYFGDVEFIWLKDEARKLIFENDNFFKRINKISEAEITFLKVINQEAFNKIHSMDMKVQNVYGQLREAFTNDIAEAKNISKIIIRDFFDIDSLEKFIVLDEAPIICDFPLLYAVAYYADRVDKRFILTYDVAQHSHNKVVALKEVISINDTYKLNIVFRTTKEIFEIATEYMDEEFEFEAPISVEDSVTFTKEPTYDNFIKFSDVIKDVDSIIGAEFENLSIVIDAPLAKENYYLYYILCTRAIKNLNIVGSEYR